MEDTGHSLLAGMARGMSDFIDNQITCSDIIGVLFNINLRHAAQSGRKDQARASTTSSCTSYKPRRLIHTGKVVTCTAELSFRRRRNPASEFRQITASSTQISSQTSSP